MSDTALDPEAGDTLVELLVAIVILGLAVTLIVGAMMTLVLGADSHRKQAVGDTVLRAWAEDVTLAGSGANYTDCASASSFMPSSVGLSTAQLQNYVPAIPSVHYWNGSTFVPSPCGTDGGLQKVTLSVSSGDLRDTESVDVVLSRQASS